MNLLTAGVMQGLMGANSFRKSADVAMGVYQHAKIKNREDIMKRSLGYAMGSVSSALESSKKAQKALKEAQKEAKEEAKAEQQAAIEKRRQEAAQNKKEQQEATRKQTIGDTVEISNEGQTGIDIKDHVKQVQDTEKTIINEGVLLEPVKITVTQGIYTLQAKSSSDSL